MEKARNYAESVAKFNNLDEKTKNLIETAYCAGYGEMTVETIINDPIELGEITTTNFLIENHNKFGLPEYKTIGSSGMDLRANIETSVELKPGGKVLMPTGIKVALPLGVEMQIRSRSGLAWKHGIVVLNSPGTVDSDYRGEVSVILYNSSDVSYMIDPGERIAQAVLANYVRGKAVQVNKIEDKTERGEGGFGHTGKN